LFLESEKKVPTRELKLKPSFLS